MRHARQFIENYLHRIQKVIFCAFVTQVENPPRFKRSICLKRFPSFMSTDVIFEPLKLRNLTVKNRILRSNISGRFDNYDGSGTQTRINWELKFARSGVGAIISSFVSHRISLLRS